MSLKHSIAPLAQFFWNICQFLSVWVGFKKICIFLAGQHYWFCASCMLSTWNNSPYWFSPAAGLMVSVASVIKLMFAVCVRANKPKQKIWLLSDQLSVRDQLSHSVSTILKMFLSQSALSRFPGCHMAHNFKSSEYPPSYSPSLSVCVSVTFSLFFSHTHTCTHGPVNEMYVWSQMWLHYCKGFTLIIASYKNWGTAGGESDALLIYRQYVCMKGREETLNEAGRNSAVIAF